MAPPRHTDPSHHRTSALRNSLFGVVMVSTPDLGVVSSAARSASARLNMRDVVACDCPR